MTTTTVPPADSRPKTPEEIERHWFENVYCGDQMPQLTVRAVAIGMVLGMVMACSNVYVSLKSGWSMGAAITACILAYVIFGGLQKIFPRMRPYNILENNCTQSSASSAGTITSSGIANAIPALMMLNPHALPADFPHRMLCLAPWVITLSMMGVFLAVPAKRQMINIEQLPFPTGTAAATTLRSLHAKGGEAARQARALILAGLLGALITWMRDARAAWMPTARPGWFRDWFPLEGFVSFQLKYLSWLHYPRIRANWGTNAIPWFHVHRVAGAAGPLGLPRLELAPLVNQGQPVTLKDLTMSLEGSLLFVAAGAIMSFRQAWSMMLGAAINYMVLAPIMLSAGIIEAPSFRRISSWSLWTGVPMMVTSGLLLFFMNWKTVVRAFSTITALFVPRGARGADPMERIEVPGSWFLGGYLILGLAVITLGWIFFHITWWMGVIAVLATFLLVVVGARATGETDVTPTGPLSKITQLTFGIIQPGNVVTNLMTANISAGSCSQASDLLTDLKSGYLLGANPRRQFIAQFFGVLAGGLIVVPVYFLLIPDVSVLGTEKWPAPAALVWRGVAELLSKGIHSLHPTARVGLVVGAALGIVLPLLERAFPKGKKFMPSATGLGLAFTINGFNVVSMFIGACLAAWFRKARPEQAGKYVVPCSSGIIAGESLMGVSIAFLRILSDHFRWGWQ
ncbi:MAG TPA: OPT family oligopeptide transporter [Candidatus Saccharimonadales bacterium]|nr:OPT family oligopeptide transporter [Candidatus Saccharimonadales bacterium]